MIRFCKVMLLSVVIISIAGCKKRNAEKTIEGDWVVYGHNTIIENNCVGGENSFSDTYTDVGEATFKDGNFTISYTATLGSPWDTLGCYNNQVAYSGTYEFINHERKTLIFHEYTIDINGEEWFVEFLDNEGDEYGEKATGSEGFFDIYRTIDDQDILYIWFRRK